MRQKKKKPQVDRREPADRRASERRQFPPRPEGRRTGGGRRQTDTAEV